MNWQIIVAKSAKKNLDRFPQKDRQRILVALEELTTNPYAGDIEKMAAEENVWRRRVGNYRILYAPNSQNKIISVTDIRRRTSSTY